jgi:tetratricopeptide (TPR) repeat protein
MCARIHGQDYDGNVIWINAETYETLKDSFLRLAKDKLNISTKTIDDQEKDINSIVQEVYKYFSKRKSLFIFDNAEKMRTKDKEKEDKGIDKFLPYFQTIHDNEPYIIITSRNENWGKIKVISLDTFTEEEAIEFIKKELAVRDESQEKEIRQLAKLLQYFPLALQQAVAYIKHIDKKYKMFKEKFEIVDYIKRYEENARKLLNFKFPEDNSNSYIKTTFITWEVTLEKIKQNKYGQQALQFLEIIAYFANKQTLELVKGIGQFSTLNMEYNMALVLGNKCKHEIFQEVSKLTECVLGGEHPSTLLTMHSTASMLDEQGKYDEALEIYQGIFNIQKRVLGTEHLDTTSTMNNMALVLDKQGKHDEALKIYQDVFNVERVLKEERPETLTTKHNMALVLYRLNKYDEALEIF